MAYPCSFPFKIHNTSQSQNQKYTVPKATSNAGSRWQVLSLQIPGMRFNSKIAHSNTISNVTSQIILTLELYIVTNQQTSLWSYIQINEKYSFLLAFLGNAHTRNIFKQKWREISKTSETKAGIIFLLKKMSFQYFYLNPHTLKLYRRDPPLWKMKRKKS